MVEIGEVQHGGLAPEDSEQGFGVGIVSVRDCIEERADFRPMTVSRYTKGAHLEKLLLRLPGALFDAAQLKPSFTRGTDRPNRTSKSEFGVSYLRLLMCA